MVGEKGGFVFVPLMMMSSVFPVAVVPLSVLVVVVPVARGDRGRGILLLPVVVMMEQGKPLPAPCHAPLAAGVVVITW